MKISISALILALGLMVTTVGCDSGSKTEPTEEKTTKTPNNENEMAVNTICPIMGSDVDPDAATVEFKGQTVGFCCDGCDDKWNNLSDEEKEQKLAEAKKKAEAKS